MRTAIRPNRKAPLCRVEQRQSLPQAWFCASVSCLRCSFLAQVALRERADFGWRRPLADVERRLANQGVNGLEQLLRYNAVLLSAHRDFPTVKLGHVLADVAPSHT